MTCEYCGNDSGIKDGAAKNLNTEADTVVLSSSGHVYTLTMTLPDGGPNINGDWSKSGNYKAWFNDGVADVDGKAYVNWVSSDFADKVTAENSNHRTRYTVSKAS